MSEWQEQESSLFPTALFLVAVEQAESAEASQPTLLLNGEALQSHQVEELTGYSGGGTPVDGRVEELREEVQDLVVAEEESDEEELCGEEEEDEEDDDEEYDEDDDDENSAEDLEEEEDEEEELVKKAQEEERKKRAQEEEEAKRAKQEDVIKKAPKEDLVREKREADLIEERPRRNQDSPKIGVKQRIEEATRRAENEERKQEKELENHRQKANNNMADAKKSRFVSIASLRLSFVAVTFALRAAGRDVCGALGFVNIT